MKRVAWVRGDRDGLWWEFPLECSFRWQAHVWRLPPDVYRRRLIRLVNSLGLAGLLDVRVADLTAEERALADLAVALLPRPEVLVWAEPFRLLGPRARARACRLVRRLAQIEGMRVIIAAGTPAGGRTQRMPG